MQNKSNRRAAAQCKKAIQQAVQPGQEYYVQEYVQDVQYQEGLAYWARHTPEQVVAEFKEYVREEEERKAKVRKALGI